MGPDYNDVRSHIVSSANTNNQNTRDDSIHKRVADIINLPSKAITPAHANQMGSSINHKMALQTFNTDSIRPHLNKNGGAVGGGAANNPRIAQSHSPTQIHRKTNDNGHAKPSVGIKAHLANMNQTFHSGQKGNNAMRGAV